MAVFFPGRGVLGPGVADDFCLASLSGPFRDSESCGPKQSLVFSERIICCFNSLLEVILLHILSTSWCCFCFFGFCLISLGLVLILFWASGCGKSKI